ncbi:MAG: hypothetical protein V4683_11660 [Bacteroidota bacterium]
MQIIKNSIDQDWGDLIDKLEAFLGVRPADLNGVLFLIGVQELGQGTRAFTKEQKQDLMHIAVCKVLSRSGFYQLEGKDADGWPHWEPVKSLPYLGLKDQEIALKSHVIDYFEAEIF